MNLVLIIELGHALRKTTVNPAAESPTPSSITTIWLWQLAGMIGVSRTGKVHNSNHEHYHTEDKWPKAWRLLRM